MKNRFRKQLSANLPPLLFAAGALSTWQLAAAQEGQQSAPTAAETGKPEEIVVVGRSLSASETLVEERLADPSVVDAISAEAISRLGDSTVAASLRRVPGLSLVSDKFVYIRGLGERYSSTSLNGSNIPSPDLTPQRHSAGHFPHVDRGLAACAEGMVARPAGQLRRRQR